MNEDLPISSSLEVNQSLTSTTESKANDSQSDKQLTAKNKLFLEHLADGKPTLEAYKLSGYKGSNHAAYELRSSLNKAYEQYLTARGMSKADLMLAVQQLNSLPLDSSQIKQGVTLKQKLDILKLWAKIMPREAVDDKPQITAFVIRTHADTAPHHVDTTVEEANNA